jgi:AraC-like DNA-binding protein
MSGNLATTASAYARTFATTDPELFGEGISEFAGDCDIQPRRRARFRADVAAAILPDVRIARIRSRNVGVVSAEGRDFIATTVPIQSTFDIHQPRGSRTFSSPTAHVLGVDDELSLHVDDGSQFIVNIATAALSKVAERLTGHEPGRAGSCGDELSLLDEAAASFVRSAARLWSDARHDPQSLSSPIGQAERQAKVVENFLLAISPREIDSSRTERHTETQKGVQRAEEWITAHLHYPITRTELCRVSRLNARTLTRAFMRRHGMSPIMFVRSRRLDNAQLTLLSADPDSTTVTDIAFDHGFTQLGRFAADYRRRFGELPSATLRA